VQTYACFSYVSPAPEHCFESYFAYLGLQARPMQLETFDTRNVVIVLARERESYPGFFV